MIAWKEYKEDCCVVIPVYAESLTNFERASLIRCTSILGNRRDIFLVAPKGLNLSIYYSTCPNYRFKVKRFSPEFFAGIDSYNELCKRHEFYESFSNYEFMLIYQLDSWVFYDDLDYFTSLEYDYFGAPWFKQNEDNAYVIDKCGNGGFSLRRISKFIEVCKENIKEADKSDVAEDIFFSNNKDIKVCPLEIGVEFSFETFPSIIFKATNEKLPMGCHKPLAFGFDSFWSNYIKI